MVQFIKISFVLFSFCIFSSLKAQTDSLFLMSDTLNLNDDDELSDVENFDSVFNADVVFTQNLVIPSYEDLLEIYYAAVVAVDSHLNFNIYRYRSEDKNTKVNPFLFAQVIYPDDSFDICAPIPDSLDLVCRNDYDIFNDVKADIALHYPDMMTATRAMIPDPPKFDLQDIIYSVDLDLSRIDTNRKAINRPDRIEQVAYGYQPWHHKAMAMANANQIAFSDWAKGGSNSFSISGQFTVDVDYESLDKKTKWDNDLEFRLGYMQQESRPFIKNLDYFRLNTRYARNAFNRWFYAFNTELTTQFFEGYDLKNENYDDPISNFLSPAYLKIALGLDYKYGTKKQKKLFSMQTSPLSFKLTYVRDTSIVSQEKYGVESGEKGREEIGGSIEFVSKYDIKDRFNAQSRLLFFSNYIDNPQNVDLNWNTSLTYHFSRIISVSFTLDMIYDDDVKILISEADDGTKKYGQRLQLKEYLGFGLTYRLM